MYRWERFPMSCSAARWLYSYETQKGEGVLFVEDQWLRKSGLCLGSWSTVEMMLNVTFSSSILLPKFSRCNIRELRQRWSGNLVRSEGGR